ncbi:YybS family protein [Clostridium botulinum]|uniref:YybS family protein n=1 Tax=Clostridium botulinum TaxID=1491 RepID=A0ABD7CJJ0_CLOBO|nr:YybS family protein [Clostridium botulinum]KGO14663.1 membrane protein [Clostridium botulinum]KIN80807.1 membrane protein [Clostridium botulinum]MCC5428105.1 YybS family protein [Clostridium botulinum]QRI53557.1 YybS family protein [Clostridium botulinum]
MYNKQNKTNSLVEAGLIVALMIVLIMLNLYFPIFTVFGSFILPIPIAVLYMRQDYKITIWAILVTGVITMLINNPITALTTTISFGIMGFLLGYCIKKEKSIFITIVILATGFLLSNIMIFFIYFSFIDKRGIIGYINENINIIKESMELTKEFYSKAGVSEDKLQQIDQVFGSLNLDSMLKMLPAALIIIAFLAAFLNYAVTKKVLMKLGYKNVKSLPSISKIYVNVRLVTIVAIGLLIGAVLKRKTIGLGDYFFITASYLLIILLLIDGISTFIYYMRNKFKISKGILIFIFLMTLGPLYIIYFYLGLADIMLDFRKLDPFRQYKNNKSGEL